MADTLVTDQGSASDSSDDVRDWLEPGESWFCEEHQQLLILEEDVLPGTYQVCLYCHPEYIYSISPMGTESDSQYVAPVGAAVSFNASALGSPTSWTNMSTLADEASGMLIYYYNTNSTTTGYYFFRFIFSEVVQPVGDYLYFYYSYSNLNNNDIRFSNHATSFPGMSAFQNVTNTDSSVQSLDYVFSGSLSQALLSGNTYYLSFFGPANNTRSFYFSGFYINVDGYTGSGGGGSGQPEEPEGPGFDDEDGWLGSLISSIIAGINEIIDGISNVAQNVASLPSNIAGALTSLFNKVVSAVTSIGDQITNALTTLGNFLIDGLKQLFIPSDGYFESVANDLSSFFSDRLGLLLYPFDFLVSLGDRIAGLETSEPTCTIPEIAYTDSDDTKYVLIEGQTLNVYDLVGRNDIIIGMHQTYLTVMDGIIAFTLMALCWKRFDHIIGGGAE